MSQPELSNDSSQYVGAELELFAHAVNWKRYWSESLRKWIQGDVLEVGSGIGSNTHLLYGDGVRSWVALEPDAAQTELARRQCSLGSAVRHVSGLLTDLADEPTFDCILYIDVLEHIERDKEEMARAASRLKPGGALVVLSPAHQFLFSPFDAAIGHYRRYNRPSLAACRPENCELVRIWYMDSVGMLTSLVNKMMLRQTMPKLEQILLWDRHIIPVSRWMDVVTGYRLGRSIVAVWRKPA